MSLNLSREETIANHRKMWNWIADETLKRKEKVFKDEYFKEYNIPKYIMPPFECFCCEYTEYAGDPIKCKKCPIRWPYQLCRLEGPYKNWCDTFDYVEAAESARQIAELPEKEVDE